MQSNRHYCGVAWVTLVAVVVGFQPWFAMAATPARAGAAAPSRYTTIPNQSAPPAARSSSAGPSRQYTTIPNAIPSAGPATPASRLPSANTLPITPITPPVAPPPAYPHSDSGLPLVEVVTTTATYEDLRVAAVKTELAAQQAQPLANQATSDFEYEAKIFMDAVQASGFTDLFNQPVSVLKTGSNGFYEVSKMKVAKKGKSKMGKVADKNEAGGMMDVRPCNQILGITLPLWVGQPFKTKDGKTYYSYSAAKNAALNVAAFDAAFKLNIGKTGKVTSSKSQLGDTYNACLNIEDMSAEISLPKKIADKIALDDADIWAPKLQTYYTAVQNYQDAVQDWMAQESHLSDLCAKMILKAEAQDPKLEGLAMDAYGFWLATKVRYYFMFGSTKLILPNIIAKLLLQNIFKDFSNGLADTSAYRAALTEIYKSATGLSDLRRLDTAFGFAASYAASLKTERKFTERVAQAAAAKAYADKVASKKSAPSGSGAITLPDYSKPSPTGNGKATPMSSSADTVSIPTKNLEVQGLAIPEPDPAMVALSNRAVEVFYVLAVPILDVTKRDGFGALWAFITNFAFDMDKYYFALNDKSSSFTSKNDGIDIYDPIAGWHKMQIAWQAPVAKAQGPTETFLHPLPAKIEINPRYKYAPGSLNFAVYSHQDQYILNGYLADHPLYEVLSQSAKEQKFWLNVKPPVHFLTGPAISLNSKLSASELIPASLMGTTNAFGVSAATMLSAQSDGTMAIAMAGVPFVEYPDLEVWLNRVYGFSNYVKKGLQADKAAGYPNLVMAKQIQNFSSVAALFHPVSVGFGTCSIYNTLHSPYNPHLGYSCGDYGDPLIDLYMPNKAPSKTSAIFHWLRRMNLWIDDNIIPSAIAQDAGVERIEDESGNQNDGGAGGDIGTGFSDVMDFFATYFGNGGGPVSDPGANDGNANGNSNNGNADVIPNLPPLAPNQVAALAGMIGTPQSVIRHLPSWYKGSMCEGLKVCLGNAYAARAVLGEYSAELSGSPFAAFSGDTTTSNRVLQAAYLQNELFKIGNKIMGTPGFRAAFDKMQTNSWVTVSNANYQKVVFEQAIRAFHLVGVAGNIEKLAEFREKFSDRVSASHIPILRGFDFTQPLNLLAFNRGGVIQVNVSATAADFVQFMYPGSNANQVLNGLATASDASLLLSFENYFTAVKNHEFIHDVNIALLDMGLISEAVARSVAAGELEHGLDGVISGVQRVTHIPIYHGESDTSVFNGDEARSLYLLSWDVIMQRFEHSGAPTQ